MATVIEPPAVSMGSERLGVGHRYVKAAVHTGIGGIASRVLQGFAPIVLARYLGPKEYGVYALVLSFVGIVTGVSNLGQNAALQKFLPEYSVKDPARGGAILTDTVIIISGALGVVCTGFLFASRWIAAAIYHDPSLTGVFQFSALLVLALTLFNLASSATAGLQDFKSYSRAMVVRSAAFVLLGWLGVWLLGLYGALLGQLLASILGLGLLTAAAIKLSRVRFPGSLRPRFSKDVLKEIFSFAFPALLAGLLVSPAYWWTNTLLARHAGFEQVGLFGVAFAMCQLIALVPSSLSVPAVSFMSETYASSNPEKFSELVGSNLRLIWALTLPIAFGCALFASRIVRLLFGGAYRDASVLAQMMSFVALVIAVGGIAGYAVAGSGRMWHACWINGCWFVVLVVVARFLVWAWGAKGLALAFGVSYALLAGFLCIYSVAFLHVRFEGLKPLVILTLVCVLSTVVLTKSLAAAPFCVTAVLAEIGLVAAEWRTVLRPSEQSRLVELGSQLFRANAA